MEQKYTIIPLEEKHLQEALALVWDVFSEFEASDYAPEGVAEFQGYIAYPAMMERLEKGELCFWGCFLNGRMVGVLAARGSCHISLLFVNKKHHRKGIARRLFLTMLDAREHTDADAITVNSSPYAMEVYVKLGFLPTDSEQTVNGIRFIPMAYVV